MNRKIWNTARIFIIAGITVLFLINGAIAETNRQKVVKEACYALDGGTDYTCDSETSTVGNWNYLKSDLAAYKNIRDLYNGFASIYWSKNKATGQYEGDFGNLDTYGFKDSKGRGGQCKYFANLIIYRAGQKGLLLGGVEYIGFTSYQSMVFDTDSRSISYTRPGDVIIDKTRIYKKPIYNKEKVVVGYKDQYYLYTVKSINKGNPLMGTVTSIQAEDNQGNVITISNADSDSIKHLPNYAISKFIRDVAYAQPADIIIQTDEMFESYDHTAVVVKINNGELKEGKVTSLDVVDSNFVGDEEIGGHTFSGAKLKKYYVYTGVSYYAEKWNPDELIMYWNILNPNDPNNGKVYEIRKSTHSENPMVYYKRWIISEKVLKDLGYKWDDVKNDPFSQLRLAVAIPGENIVYKDGTLIETKDGSIYEMKDGEKHKFTSEESYAAHGYNKKTPRVKVSDEEFNAIPTGLAMDFQLVKKEDGTVYVIEGNERRHVMDPKALEVWGLDKIEITQIVDDVWLSGYTDKGDLGHIRFGIFVGQKSQESIKETGVKQYFISVNKDGDFVKREIYNSEIRQDLGDGPVYWLGDYYLTGEFEFYSIGDGILYAPLMEPNPVIIGDLQNCQDCHSEPIPAPKITIVSPNGGENLKIGSTYDIQANIVGDLGTSVKIELLKDGKKPKAVKTIENNFLIGNSSTISYPWTIVANEKPGDSYIVRVTSNDIPIYLDTSDTAFKISKGKIVPTPTVSPTPTVMPTPINTSTPVPTATSTPIPTATAKPSPTPTIAPTPTLTPEPTVTATPAPTETPPPPNSVYVAFQNQIWLWAPLIQGWAYGTLYPIYANPADGSFLMDTPYGTESYIERSFNVPINAINLSARIWGAKNMDGNWWCGEPVITTVSLIDSSNIIHELDKFTPIQMDNGIGDNVDLRNYSLAPYTSQTVKIRIGQTSVNRYCTYGYYKDIGIQTS